jgi:hypothetical protein
MSGRKDRPGPPSTVWTAATLLRLAAAPAFLALVATLVLGTVLAGIEGSPSVAPNAWLLFIGGLALWFCWRVLTTALPPGRASAFDSVRDRPAEAATRLPEIVDIEAVLLDAEWSWTGVDHGLRPLLRRIAAARLLEKHQLDLESQPEASRHVLGEELWALVGPDRVGPAGAAAAADPSPAGADTRPRRSAKRRSDHRRGMPRETIKRAIELLEAL